MSNPKRTVKPSRSEHANATSANARAANPRQRRQQHLLDVRVRAREVNRHRRQRLFYWLSALLLLLAVGGGIYLATTRGVARLFYQNPDYNVTAVNIETDGVLSREQVLDCAGLREGMNIFKVNLDLARERLETLPQVQRAQIQRELPNRISITITERKPVAWIAPESLPAKGGKPVPALTREEVFASKNSFLVDASGILLRPQKIPAQNFSLPIIRGGTTDKMTPGGRADSEEIHAALNLIDLYQNSLLGARFQITDIDVSRGYGLVATDRNNTQVLFALDDLELQLKTLEILLRAIDATGKRPATISLATMAFRQRNIPVTFQTEVPADSPAAVSNTTTGQSGAIAAPLPTVTPTAAKPGGGSNAAQQGSSPKPAHHNPRIGERTARRSRPETHRVTENHSSTGGFRGGQPQNEPPVPRALPVQ